MSTETATDTEQGGLPAPAPEGDKPATTKKPLAKRVRNWGLLGLVVVVLMLWGYRWAGTNSYEGTVQRVYEKEGSLRVELELASGEVRVFENADQGFPHFKTDSADMQAVLHRMARSGDRVALTTWGFRNSLASAFPNVVDFEHLESASERRRARAEQLADKVLRELTQQNALNGDADDVREDVVQAIERGLRAPAAGRE